MSEEKPVATLTESERRDAAESLLRAEKERKPVRQLSSTWPHITIEDAYAIQRLVNEAKLRAGSKVIGNKIGLTSKAMQQSSQIDEPDYGVLHDYMMIEDGASVPIERFIVPRIELELVFVLGSVLHGPGVGLVDVLRATEYVVPAIEIIDARVQNPRKIFDTVADNGAAAGIVLGGRAVKPMDIDLRWVGGLLYRNADIEETGVSAGVLGHPAMGIAWLANKVGRFGESLEPGKVMLSGSFVRPVWARKGDTVRADFGPLGSLSVHFG
jgi:2-oxo-hept-3-ene-1,7-dioate hydratase